MITELQERLNRARSMAMAARAVQMPGRAAMIRAKAIREYQTALALAAVHCEQGETLENFTATAQNELDACKNTPTCDDAKASELQAILRASDITPAEMPPLLRHVSRYGFIAATDDPDLDAKEIADILAEDMKPKRIAAKAKPGFALNTGESHD